MVLTASVFDFDKMTNDKMTTSWKKSKNNWWFIRRPQSKSFTFALSNWRSDEAVFKGKNCES